jgi:hypothetical protein
MSRNPFDVLDVPDPHGEDVMTFANGVRLTGSADDENAEPWSDTPTPAVLAGNWSSRWKGEEMPWQRGQGKLSVVGTVIYILFDWQDGAQQGLLEARWDGQVRLVGRYVNLGNREIVRPWVGRVVDATRIDGEYSGGRLDFRR